MTLEHWVLVILTALNFFQFIFWSWQNQTLVNKIMCRNYADYVLSKDQSVPVVDRSDDKEAIVEELEILNELNGQLRGAAS